jgi:hypothetical protein
MKERPREEGSPIGYEFLRFFAITWISSWQFMAVPASAT